MTPDANVLVAAARSDHPQHAVARAWLEETLAGSESGTICTLMPMVLASFLRLTSSPKLERNMPGGAAHEENNGQVHGHDPRSARSVVESLIPKPGADAADIGQAAGTVGKWEPVGSFSAATRVTPGSV